MEFRWQGLGRRLHFSFEKVTIVTGVNSKIDEHNHFLMWDFDDKPLSLVMESLLAVQKRFNLPAITILSTGKPGGYHAYCFKRYSFIEVQEILASTRNLDKNYLALGIGRGYFTLRFSDVKGREFERVAELPSTIPSDCCPKDACGFVKYTKRMD